MAQPLVIPLATPGLVKADFGFRFYANGTADAATAAALTITERAGGDYAVSGLPDPVPGTPYTLTWEYPPGSGAAFIYPPAQLAAPANVIIPVRETGLVAADFAFRLYLDGATRADVLTATEVGSPGDYRVTGWPTNVRGAWVLVWERYGLSYSFGWTSTGAITGYHGEANAFRDRLIANWGTTAIDFGSFGGRKLDPTAGTAFIRPGITGLRSAQRALATAAGLGWRFIGEFWLQIFVPDTWDDAGQKIEQYADSIASIFRGQTFADVSCGEASFVRVGPSGGFMQGNVLVRFRRDERF